VMEQPGAVITPKAADDLIRAAAASFMETTGAQATPGRVQLGCTMSADSLTSQKGANKNRRGFNEGLGCPRGNEANSDTDERFLSITRTCESQRAPGITLLAPAKKLPGVADNAVGRPSALLNRSLIHSGLQKHTGTRRDVPVNSSRREHAGKAIDPFCALCCASSWPPAGPEAEPGAEACSLGLCLCCCWGCCWLAGRQQQQRLLQLQQFHRRPRRAQRWSAVQHSSSKHWRIPLSAAFQ
jgi:hypothetical protein